MIDNNRWGAGATQAWSFSLVVRQKAQNAKTGKSPEPGTDGHETGRYEDPREDTGRYLNPRR